MDETFRALGLLLLKAIPTFVLVVLLHFYLKWIYFRPMQRVLQARSEATEGARRLAEQTLAQASAKAAEYEAALRTAHTDIYREQEELRQRWRQEHGEALTLARERAEAALEQARQQLAGELEMAKHKLRLESDSLAEEIVEAILRGRVA